MLDCIRRTTAGISRVEIAQLTALSEQTVSNLTRRLLDQGLAVELGREIKGVGKPRTMLGLNPDGMYAVGVHLDPASIAVVLVNLAGEVVEQTVVPVADEADPQVVVADIARAVALVVADRDPVMGVGVGVPGPIDAERGVMINPPLLERWRDVPIAELMMAAIGLPVSVEKDLIVAAGGEAWLRQGGATPDFLYTYLGAGLGFGLVHEGAVQRGVSHNFGEVNIFLIQTPGPHLSCCVIPGSFAHRVSPRHLIFAAADVGALSDDVVRRASNSPAGRDALLAALVDQARDGDPRSSQVFATLAHDLAEGLAPLSDLLDVSEIVIGGHSWAHYGGLVEEPLADRLAQRAVLRTARPVHVQTSAALESGIALGAATMVLDERVSPDARGLSGRQR
ncbi:ROK family protein [Aestuariimicrobium soli]|uniref:ROK family protein n=1 Tax=Aestuariimicrobium soli TaxID=2035834 RepID=UPI003EBF140B